jgi:hypothetical protein
MLHHSKFSLFAFLALLGAAVSGCMTSYKYISSDPQTAEDILRATTEHVACVTLMDGDSIHCYSVAVRKDSTTWRGFEGDVSVPTNSVASIKVPTPEIGTGFLIGMTVGAVLIGGMGYGLGGGVIGEFDDKKAAAGALYGVIVGAVFGGAIGGAGYADHQTTWTLENRGVPGRLTWDAVNKRWWDAVQQRWVYPPNDTLHSGHTIQTKSPH